jgi:ATP-binding cassette subfamily B protein
MLKTLWNFLSKRRQKQFWLLLILMFVASLAEIVSLGSVLPFLGILTAPDQVFQHQLMQPVIQFLGLTDSAQLILPLTIVFIVATLLAGVIRLLLLYVMIRLSYATGADLSINIYRRTLYQDYSIHVARNSSEVINGIISKTSTVINAVLTPMLVLISSIILIIGITSALFVINVSVALTASIGFGLVYWGIIRYTRRQLKENSECIATQSTLMIKSLQEGLGGIRDVLIDGSQQFYCQLYRNSDRPLRKASGDNQFISGSPRYLMEAIGMTLIAVLAYLMTRQHNDTTIIIPVLGTLAFGAQRLLPAMQQSYSSYSTIKGATSSLSDILELLHQPLPDCVDRPAPIVFEKDIELKNLSFRYTKDSPWILKNINLKINKGSRIGFVGSTGSGKSTLIDIIMGLLPPTEGELIIDEKVINNKNRRTWYAHISHVPQSIYLSDGTIEDNIAFGVPKEKVDHEQVIKASQQAKISELINDWKEGYKTMVGERGVRLSGGQRQRIGIARALYKKVDVLIFDEATSALDNSTERSIMKSIEGLEKNLTILIIAHRLTSLKNCDQIVTVDRVTGVNNTSYQDIIKLDGKEEGNIC